MGRDRDCCTEPRLVRDDKKGACRLHHRTVTQGIDRTGFACVFNWLKPA
jgi:hypothetical protein